MERQSELMSKISELRSERQQLIEAMIPVRDHEERVEGLQGELQRKEEEISALRSRIENMDASLRSLMQDLQRTEVVRKHLHNHVQMLKGSMRVFCRIKPLQNS